jgi:heterodisulfide reductase subunit D
MDAAIKEMFEVAEACSMCRCGCCKDQCPMYSEILEESISPKGRNAVIRALSLGILEPDERAVRIAYSCLLCKRDEFSCTAKLKNADATEAFRKYLLEMGMPLLPEHEVLVKSLENYGNPWQESKVARKRWARDLKARRAVAGKTDVLFYVGCTFALDRTLQESPRALASLMKKAGVNYGLLLEDELCCGSTVKRIGHVKLFEKLRAENEKRLRDIAARAIVTGCAGCYKTLRQDYPGLAKDIQILHSTEYLAGLLDSGKLKVGGKALKVTYHDPCHLGRHAEVYEPPRRILRSIPGLELIEMRNSREMSRCCGGGAGVKTAYPELSQKAALRRLKEAEVTGAVILVTACPFCVQTLGAAANATGSAIEVLELSVLLDRLSTAKGSG